MNRLRDGTERWVVLNGHTKLLQIGSRFGLHGRGAAQGRSNMKEDGDVEEIINGDKDYSRPRKILNSGNTSEDLAALDRLITYLLSQPSNSAGGNLDTWRRSHRASSRGYRQLRGTAANIAEAGDIGTTPL